MVELKVVAATGAGGERGERVWMSRCREQQGRSANVGPDRVRHIELEMRDRRDDEIVRRPWAVAAGKPLSPAEAWQITRRNVVAT